MKIIVSHDVDHWRLDDHWVNDLFLQKYLAKNFTYMLKGNLSMHNFRKRIQLLFNNRMNRLEEVLQFDKSHGLNPTCFVGFANGLSLSYNIDTAKQITSFLKKKGITYFPHGIAYNNEGKMKVECDQFLNTLDEITSPRGIRMHYLRHDESTYGILKKLGYNYCSNAYFPAEATDPYWVDEILEFPVTMMDVYEIHQADNSPVKAIERSLNSIEEADRSGLKYFTLVFHDNYFADAFWQYREWYKKVIRFMASKYEFTTFAEAYTEISAVTKSHKA